MIPRMGYFECKSNKDFNVWEYKDFPNISDFQVFFFNCTIIISENSPQLSSQYLHFNQNLIHSSKMNVCPWYFTVAFFFFSHKHYFRRSRSCVKQSVTEIKVLVRYRKEKNLKKKQKTDLKRENAFFFIKYRNITFFTGTALC